MKLPRRLWLGYLVFVIYGSLVPFHFRALSLNQTLVLWGETGFIPLLEQSRSDLAVNFLLLLPLSYLSMMLLLRYRRDRSAAWLAAILVFSGAVTFALMIEFCQIFFPPRVVSYTDVLMQGLGALAGIALWLTKGPALTQWFGSWSAVRGLSRVSARLLIFYLAGYYLYSLLPLDLTISPAEIYHKWREGRILLLPWQGPASPISQMFYGLVTDVALWLPAGLLWRFSSSRSNTHIWRNVLFSAALLEFLQIFVYTRVTDSADIVTAGVGAALGIWLASRFGGGGHVSRPRSIQLALWGASLWLILVFTVFWFPYNFEMSQAFLEARVTGLWVAPLSNYYYSSEYRAATEMLHKTLFFMPLGALLAYAAWQAPSRRFWLTASALAVAVSAFILEFGQLLLPGKYADMTDCLLESLGGWLGMMLVASLRGKLHHAEPAPLRQPTQAVRLGWPVAVQVLALAALIAVASQLPQLPYNVRELVASEHRWLSALLLAFSVYWCLAPPVWALPWLRVAGFWKFPLFTLLHGTVAWLLLYFAVPMEALEDIVGSPVLHWPWQWELLGRFVALFSVPSLLLSAAALFATARRSDRPAQIAWGITALLLLPLAHWIVVTQAATDNLTELMAQGGGFSASLFLTLALAILLSTGTRLAVVSLTRGHLAVWAWVLLSFPAAYAAIYLGTEQHLVKYGKTFSALQFLLSANREHYAASATLILRYALLHGALLLLIVWVQRPFWRMQTHA